MSVIIKNCGHEATAKIRAYVEEWNDREQKAVGKSKWMTPLTINMLNLERDTEGENGNNQYKGVIMITVPIGGADASVLASYYFDLNADGYELHKTTAETNKGKNAANTLMSAIKSIIFDDYNEKNCFQF